MPVRTRTLVGDPLVGTGAYEPIYECPPGCLAIVRRYALYQQGGSGIVALATFRDGTVRGILWVDLAAPDGFLVEAETWTALEPGDELRLFAGVDRTILVWISGPELVT